MKAAVVKEPGKTPVFAEFSEPTAEAGQELITVTASALSHVTKSRASGSHHTAPGDFPAVVGIDGVGRTQDGRQVYFVLPEAPFGGMAEKTVVEADRCIPLPDGLDDVTAAAMVIPGMSSWAALEERARLVPGESVVVNGATGASGRLAVQIAKHLGAKKVIATGRDTAALEPVKALGADVTIPLLQSSEELETAFKRQFAEGGVHVVLDYLWGQSAEVMIVALAKTADDTAPIRFVQIGALSGGSITLPSAALRSSPLVLMGSGIGSISLPAMVGAIRGVLQAAGPASLQIKTETVPLADVEKAWNRNNSKARIVFAIGQASQASA